MLRSPMAQVVLDKDSSPYIARHTESRQRKRITPSIGINQKGARSPSDSRGLTRNNDRPSPKHKAANIAATKGANASFIPALSRVSPGEAPKKGLPNKNITPAVAMNPIASHSTQDIPLDIMSLLKLPQRWFHGDCTYRSPFSAISLKTWLL
jgi:hypothetical protein